MDEIEERLKKWHSRKFPKGIDPVRTALKICEESGEIAKAVLREDWENLEEELADVYFLLLHLARYRKTTLKDCALKKLPIIERRAGIK